MLEQTQPVPAAEGLRQRVIARPVSQSRRYRGSGEGSMIGLRAV